MEKEELAKFFDAKDTICSFCNESQCDDCKITRILETVDVELEE